MTENQLAEQTEVTVTVTKLDIKEVLSKTAGIYKDGFKPFLILSFLGYIITICTTIGDFLIPYSSGWSIFALVLALAAIYITIKSNVGIYLLTSSILQGNILSAKESLRGANGLCGTYFGISLLYGLILALPAMAVALSYSLVDNLYLKWGMVTLFGIPLVFLSIRYYFALAFGLLSGSSNGEFARSKHLVASGFWRILAVVAVTLGISIIIPMGLTVIIGLNNQTVPGLIIATVAGAVISIVVAPVSNIATVVMYYSLIRNNGLDNPMEQTEEVPDKKEGIAAQYERVDQPQDETIL